MRNNWVQFLLCLLLSSAIWLIHNLSGSYVGLVSVPVQAKSNIEAHSEMSTTDATVTARPEIKNGTVARIRFQAHYVRSETQAAVGCDFFSV